MKLLSKEDIEKVAKEIQVDPSLLFAVDLTESNGRGFYLDEGIYKGELKVLKFRNFL